MIGSTIYMMKRGRSISKGSDVSFVARSWTPLFCIIGMLGRKAHAAGEDV